MEMLNYKDGTISLSHCARKTNSCSIALHHRYLPFNSTAGTTMSQRSDMRNSTRLP